MTSPKLTLVTHYPEGKNFTGTALGAAFSLHISGVLLVALLAWIFQVKSLKDLMAQGGTIAESGPAAQEVEIELKLEEPPPPTDHVEFIRQIVKPPPTPPPPPTPKPVVKVDKPKVKPTYTAPKATGDGESQSSSKLVVGSSGFPHPTYPAAAVQMHLGGTVVLSIQFDGSGHAMSVDVTSSSGVGILDSYSRSFIREHWENSSFAGRTATVPIEYDPNNIH